MLDNRAGDLKAVRFTIGMIMGVAFFDLFAFFADKELRQMSIVVMFAGDKGI